MFKYKKMIERIDLLGRKTQTSNIYIDIYNDGSVAKKYLINSH